MAKKISTGTILAIGGAAAILGGAAAILARMASKKAAQDIADALDGMEVEIEVCPDEKASAQSDFVDTDGAAEEAPAPEAPAAEEAPIDPAPEAPAPEA